MHLSDQQLKKLEIKANEIRKDIIKMLVKAGSGHSAGPLGMADVFTAMYFHVLNHKPKKSDLPERDPLGAFKRPKNSACAQGGEKNRAKWALGKTKRARPRPTPFFGLLF